MSVFPSTSSLQPPNFAAALRIHNISAWAVGSPCASTLHSYTGPSTTWLHASSDSTNFIRDKFVVRINTKKPLLLTTVMDSQNLQKANSNFNDLQLTIRSVKTVLQIPIIWTRVERENKCGRERFWSLRKQALMHLPIVWPSDHWALIYKNSTHWYFSCPCTLLCLMQCLSHEPLIVNLWTLPSFSIPTPICNVFLSPGICLRFGAQLAAG